MSKSKSEINKKVLKEWKKFVYKTNNTNLIQEVSRVDPPFVPPEPPKRKGGSPGPEAEEGGMTCPPGSLYVPGKGCVDHPESEGEEDPRLAKLCPPGTVRQGTDASGLPMCEPDTSKGKTKPDKKKKGKYGSGCKNKDSAVGKELMAKMKEAASEEGKSSFYQLPMSHPARANYRAWYKCETLPYPDDAPDVDPEPEPDDGGSEGEWAAILAQDGSTVIWYREGTGEGQCDCPDELTEEECAAGVAKLEGTEPGPGAPDASPCMEGAEEVPVEDQEPEGPEEPECDAGDLIEDAYELYQAMKGMMTDEDAIYAVLRKYGTSCARELYDAYERVLKRRGDTDDGDLFDWLIDDGERTAAKLLRRAIMDQSRRPMQESKVFVRTKRTNKKRRR